MDGSPEDTALLTDVAVYDGGTRESDRLLQKELEYCRAGSGSDGHDDNIPYGCHGDADLDQSSSALSGSSVYFCHGRTTAMEGAVEDTSNSPPVGATTAAVRGSEASFAQHLDDTWSDDEEGDESIISGLFFHNDGSHGSHGDSVNERCSQEAGLFTGYLGDDLPVASKPLSTFSGTQRDAAAEEGEWTFNQNREQINADADFQRQAHGTTTSNYASADMYSFIPRARLPQAVRLSKDDLAEAILVSQVSRSGPSHQVE